MPKYVIEDQNPETTVRLFLEKSGEHVYLRGTDGRVNQYLLEFRPDGKVVAIGDVDKRFGIDLDGDGAIKLSRE